MAYVDKILVNGESVEYRAKKAWIGLAFTIVLIIFLLSLFSKSSTSIFVILILFFSYLILKVVIAFISNELALTNKRIIGKKGLILRNTMEFGLNKVESISVSQPLLGRIFRFGTIIIVGTGGSIEEFKAIKNPYELQRVFNDLASDA